MAHYGIKTRYLDLVDSIPIAIWFSIYNLKEKCYDVKQEDDEYSYLFIYGVNANEKRAEGIWDGSTQRLVSLRDAFPPYALRPHVQHAYSLCDLRLLNEMNNKRLREELGNYMNYKKYVLAIIKFKKEDAINWLGQNREISEHLSFKILFPPPEEDKIFEKLLSRPYQSPLIWIENIDMIPDDKINKKLVEHWRLLGLIEPFGYGFHETDLDAILEIL